MRRSSVSSPMGVATPPPAGRRPCSILFAVQGAFQGAFNGEEVLSEEEFCIQPNGRCSSASGMEEPCYALYCSLFRECLTVRSC